MKPGIDYELFTEHVWKKLASNPIFNTSKIRHNTKLMGKSGCKHQIDVFWVYEKDGHYNRVVIECKNYNSKVAIGKVRDFYGVLIDLRDVHGIMVSKKGFQKGAKRYAKHYGITLKELREPLENESIGAVRIGTQSAVRRFTYKIDSDWAERNHFSIEGYRKRICALYGNPEEWQDATHLPVETIGDGIMDANGIMLKTTDDLEKEVPTPLCGNFSYILKFQDAWIQSRYYGLLKISEIKYECINKQQETLINIAADEFVEGILKDVQNNQIELIGKY